MEKESFFSSKNIATLGVLTSLVLILQIALGVINAGGASFSIVLIPITIGSALLGVWGGAYLGFVFGAATILCGVIGFDPFAYILFNVQPVATVVICLVKGTACGIVPALIFKYFRCKNEKLAVFLAAASAPIVNTGLFIVGMFVFKSIFYDSLAGVEAYPVSNYVFFVFIFLAGKNFIIEFIVNLLTSTAMYTVIKAVEKKYFKEKKV